MNIFDSDKDICAHVHVEERGGVNTFSFVPNVFWDFYTTIQDHNDIVIENLKRLFKTGPLIYLSSFLGKASKKGPFFVVFDYEGARPPAPPPSFRGKVKL